MTGEGDTKAIRFKLYCWQNQLDFADLNGSYRDLSTALLVLKRFYLIYLVLNLISRINAPLRTPAVRSSNA